jgi:succinyl-diaminopimelate desuccinylase
VIDAVDLTRALIALDTAGGGEDRAARLLAAPLEAAGARVSYDVFAAGRSTLVAHIGDTSHAPLILSGHLDTVPAAPAGWSDSPLAGRLIDGRVFGRGAADMKSGVAALVVAVLRCLDRGDICGGVMLILTAAEESGCEGAAHLVAGTPLPTGGRLLVAEPTSNRVATAHKGALWLRLDSTGIAAHGSRPDLGRNAITPLARVAVALADAGLAGVHPVMGPVTVNVGTLNGGVQPNLVPDAASMTLDIRLVPGVSAAETIQRVLALAGPGVEVSVMLNRSPVFSPPEGRFATLVQSIADSEPHPPLGYFTDASMLAEAMGCTETVFFGPGDAMAAHTVNESCPVERIYRAAEVYEAVIATVAKTPAE